MTEPSSEKPPSTFSKFKDLFHKNQSNSIEPMDQEGEKITKLQNQGKLSKTLTDESRRIETEIETSKSDEEIYAKYKMEETLTKKLKIPAIINGCSNTKLLLAYKDLQQIYENQYIYFKFDYDHEVNERHAEILRDTYESLGVYSKEKVTKRKTKRPNETSEDRLKRIIEEKKEQRSPLQIKMDETEEQINRNDISFEKKTFLIEVYKKLHERNLNDYTKKFLDRMTDDKDSR